MSELCFPLFGALLVFGVVVPLLTVAARSAVSLWSGACDSGVARESPLRFMAIIAPTLGPVIWLISAVIHQSEEGAALSACFVDHLGSDLCRDVVIFGLLLCGTLGASVLRRARGEWGAGRSPVLAGLAHREAAYRVAALCDSHPRLSAFASRIHVMEQGLAPACTRGVLRPRVEVEARLVERLDDEELLATLLHEVEHAQAQDPLRLFVAHVALSLNPLRSLLAPELARYQFTREALCDKRAVQQGADPLALARSLVSVAAPAGALAGAPAGALPGMITALGGYGISGVRVRVQLLLGYAACRPAPERALPRVGTIKTLVVLLSVWPHLLGAGPLDMLHRGIERAVLLFAFG